MRREILKWKDVACRQRNNGIGIAGRRQFAEALQDRNEVLHCTVVVHDQNERAFRRALEKHKQKGLCCRGQSRNTKPPRALLQMGGSTRESGKSFHVRKEFADEGKKHADLILTGVWQSSAGLRPVEVRVRRRRCKAHIRKRDRPLPPTLETL